MSVVVRVKVQQKIEGDPTSCLTFLHCKMLISILSFQIRSLAFQTDYQHSYDIVVTCAREKSCTRHLLLNRCHIIKHLAGGIENAKISHAFVTLLGISFTHLALSRMKPFRFGRVSSRPDARG